MKTPSVDLLNTGLLFVAFLLAIVMPFQLFLLAYAILGPLHYLTEISWLKHHQFFSKEKRDGLILTLIAVCLVPLLAIPTAISGFDPFVMLIFMAFGMSGVFLVTSSMRVRLVSAIGLFLVALFLVRYGIFVSVFAVFLPTLIHVYLFTALFMLYGALSGKSFVGILNVGLLFFLGAILLFFGGTEFVGASAYVQESYLHTFSALHYAIAHLLGQPFVSSSGIFSSSVGIAIMQFIAFAYTYHYLNWFSKTRVIRWGESAKKYRYAIGLLWVLSVGAYAYSYTIGFILLYFLSFLHVLLEFPLNHKTMVALFARVSLRPK